MKKPFFITLVLLATVLHLYAQELQLTRNGQISFFSSTPVEDIKAINNEVSSILNTKSGSLQFVVLIKGFQFRKAAMQDHFNEKEYLNSDKFPKAEFKGTITDVSKVNFKKDGTYPVTAEGTLTLHGVSNKIKIPGTVSIKAGKVSTASKFSIKLSDYNVTVPAIVSSKIAESVEITVNCNYEPYQPKS